MKAFKLSTACCLCGLTAAMCLLASVPVCAQRVQFPTMVDPGAATDAITPPLTPVTPAQAWPSGPSPTFAASPVANGTVASSPFSGTAPAFDPYSNPIAQAPAPYSPYAPSPYSPTPQPLYPDGLQMPQIVPPGTTFPSFGQPLRFLQEVRIRDGYLFGSNSSSSLSLNTLDTSATFAVPFLGTANPLLITPGYSMYFFGGPVTTPENMADLPARTYDAYLDGAWHPQITSWLSANLGVRGGAYTDFSTFNTHSIRIMGRGLGIVSFTPTMKLAVGVVYIDRNLIKLLPAGGLIWTPNPDARYEILFPNPKLARRYATIGTTDIWWYASGEYGGGAWTIKRADGSSDDVDYNDIRVNLGIEGFALSGLHGLFEVGYVFNRQVIYRDSEPNFYPANTVMLRAGLTY